MTIDNEHIDDKIRRLFKESKNTDKGKHCPKSITLEILAEAMGSSRDAQIHIKQKNKQVLWEAYYNIMLFNIDAPIVKSWGGISPSELDYPLDDNDHLFGRKPKNPTEPPPKVKSKEKLSKLNTDLVKNNATSKVKSKS